LLIFFYNCSLIIKHNSFTYLQEVTDKESYLPNTQDIYIYSINSLHGLSTTSHQVSPTD